MRKCRLNPGFKDFLKAVGYFILTTLGAVAIVGTYLLAMSGLSAVYLYYSESYNGMAYLAQIGTFHDVDTLKQYAFEAGKGFCLMVTSIIICTLISGALVYGIYNEISESYNYKKRELEYKFQGKKQPWYRILISYIIVCEITK